MALGRLGSITLAGLLAAVTAFAEPPIPSSVADQVQELKNYVLAEQPADRVAYWRKPRIHVETPAGYESGFHMSGAKPKEPTQIGELVVADIRTPDLLYTLAFDFHAGRETPNFSLSVATKRKPHGEMRFTDNDADGVLNSAVIGDQFNNTGKEIYFTQWGNAPVNTPSKPLTAWVTQTFDPALPNARFATALTEILAVYHAPNRGKR